MSFLSQLTKIVNTGQSRSIVLTGNIYDLFFDGNKYVPLMDFLTAKLKSEPIKGQQKGICQILWQINRSVEIVGEKCRKELNLIWGESHNPKSLDDRLNETNDNSTYAFELLRQVTECCRKAVTENNLLVIIEAADMLLPENEIARMSVPDRRRVSIVHDWFSDPEFMNGHDTVILLSESRSNIHHRISRLPNVLAVEIPLPNIDQRLEFIVHFSSEKKLTVCAKEIAEQTAGLSLHAIRQLLCSGDYSAANVATKVEEYMVSQLGEGVVEFKRPTHTIDSVIGNSLVKKFLKEELIPGFKADGKRAISGAAVGGPIGGGKTYICEAVASELNIPVIVLKNIRSKWFGETDQIFERMRRLLESFYKIVIFVDEADTMFGDIQSDHDTERRLTGKVQSMMSDPALKGRVIWFLMTARIHRLSPDIRRPGRMDLILPILDPEGDDLKEFIFWTLGDIPIRSVGAIEQITQITSGYSAASFSFLRNRILDTNCERIDDVLRVAQDIILPDIAETREYQTLQAKLNCTRRSLLVSPEVTREEFEALRATWKARVAELEQKGVS